MFYHARRRNQRVAALLDTTEGRFAVTHGDVRGYLPYGDFPVYEDEDIAEQYLGDADATWTSAGPIWIEGSLGVATAYAKADIPERAAEILRDMETFRHPNGGFQYADREIPHWFATHRSVAATGWYVLAERVLNNQAVRETFWSGMQ